MFPCPLAQPFEPTASLEFAIFNDGVPSSVFYGMHPEHDIVQHIPGDAIEELFPPTADDLSELEAADDFVETMAWLSYLDEQEEQARLNFAGYGKRWSARRKDGLIGKPNPPKQDRGRYHDIDGGRSLSSSSSADEVSLVSYAPRMFEVKPRKSGNSMYAARASVPKNARGVMHGHRGMIHQPRKHY